MAYLISSEKINLFNLPLGQLLNLNTGSLCWIKGTRSLLSLGQVIYPKTKPNILSKLVSKDNVGSPTGISNNMAAGYWEFISYK